MHKDDNQSCSDENDQSFEIEEKKNIFEKGLTELNNYSQFLVGFVSFITNLDMFSTYCFIGFHVL